MMAGDGNAKIASDRPVPKVRPGYVLVKTKAVALNPTDWKHIKNFNNAGHLVGCDYSGIVEEVGSNIQRNWKKGDRICGDRKSTRLNSSHSGESRMPSSA